MRFYYLRRYKNNAYPIACYSVISNNYTDFLNMLEKWGDKRDREFIEIPESCVRRVFNIHGKTPAIATYWPLPWPKKK